MKRRRIARRSRANSRVVLAAGTIGMARKCSVKNCEIDDEFVRSIGLSLHKFPRDPALRSNWIINCGFQINYKPQSGAFICHRHFCRSDYDEQQVKANGKRFILKKGSLPTIFDNYNNHPDPVITLGQNSNVSYPQEDLDLINSEVMNLDHGDSSMCLSDTSRILSEVDENCSGVNSTLNSTTNLLNMSELSDVSNNKCHANGDINDVHNIAINENVRDKAILTKNSSAECPPPSTITKSVTNIDQTTNVNKEENKNVNVTKSDRIKRIGRSEKPTKDEQRLRVNRSGLKFFPDAKLEAKDFNEKWYAARVVETDWVDREVLIHFDKWSSRFDEWIPMDSSRLRVPQMPSREPKMRGFSVGERILATWADGRKYPAKVNAVLGNDRYDVLFDDGYAKIVRSSKMTKVASTTTKAVDKVAESEPYIGSKQERRDKKRKHTVMELFQHKRRSKPDSSAAGTPIKKDANSCADRLLNVNHHNNGDNDTAVGDCYYDSSSELLHGFENPKPKVKNYSRRKRESLAKIVDTDHEDDTGPEWIDGEPQGIESFVVDGNDGSRRSIIVSDKKLPPGWQKHFIQRRTGSSAGKWDVLFLHKSTGKKFRSRNDIRIFFEAQGQMEFDPDMFDFCIHRRKRPGGSKSKSDTPVEVQKKIKTLLPKTKTPTAATDDLLLTSASYNTTVPIMTSTTSVDDSAVFIGGLRVEMEDSAYKCPKEGCCKTFRKENLLQMHIKHYHPEFSKYLGSTPNVADLAYARTIGESLLDITPKKSTNFTDRGGKFEKRKIGHDKALAATQSAHSPGQSALSSSSLFVSLPSPHVNGDIQTEGDNHHNANISRDDTKFETMSQGSNANFDIEEEISKKSDDNCAMSPGALFDMKIREVKSQVGIKTLLPVRPIASTTGDNQKNDRSKLITDDNVNNEKGKGYRKRQLSEYSSDTSTKSKRRNVGVPEFADDYGDLDDSALDAEGPAALVYRFSRRTSDTKSDDNSQSSQLNDSHIEKSDTAITHNNNDLKDGDGIMMMINGEMVKVEQLRREEIINCTCGFMEEDGLMIQCDLCLCWQHGHCNSIEREKDVPEKYICFICRHPYRQRPSKKYIHDQDWIKEGKLPSLSKRTKNQAVINQRIAMLKRSYDLVSILLQVKQILQSLRVKTNVAQKKDHPKLYLWAKNWDKSDIPTPNMEPVPILEIIKNEPEITKNDVENSQQTDSIKIETKPPIKDDLDVKSIATDTELMKILEEGNATMSDETKMIKNEDKSSNNDGQILLDALTKNNSPDELKCNNDDKIMEIKLENGNDQDQAIPKNINENIVNENEKSLVESKILESQPFQPLQPFIPEPEAPIDPAECRLRLLEHIEHFQNHIDARLTTVEAQLVVLEVMDDENEITESTRLDVHPRIKQTMQMLLRDLNTVRKLAALC